MQFPNKYNLFNTVNHYINSLKVFFHSYEITSSYDINQRTKSSQYFTKKNRIHGNSSTPNRHYILTRKRHITSPEYKPRHEPQFWKMEKNCRISGIPLPGLTPLEIYFLPFSSSFVGFQTVVEFYFPGLTLWMKFTTREERVSNIYQRQKL